MISRKYFAILVSILAISLAIILIFAINRKTDKKIPQTSASTTSKTVSETTEWNLGTKTNILSSSGSLTLSDVSATQLDLVALASSDPTIVTVSADSANKIKPVDDYVDPLTALPTSAWEVHLTSSPEQHEWWQIDLGGTYQLSQVRAFADGLSGDFKIQTSTNGTDFTDKSGYDFSLANYLAPDWYSIDFSASARYVRFEVRLLDTGDPDPFVRLSELRTFSTGEGTHTSAATQITNANLYQWQTFTPTYTAPANTTVSYRFRTSTDAATWTDWTAYQTPNSAEALDISSLVTSKTGDAGSETFYKYIQVETKLTSSDGVSTPTVDSYSIGYHTNVVPSKPTGATATAGS